MKKHAYLTILLITTTISCTSVKKVAFSKPIDTTDKPIVLQEKKQFEVSQLGVYASNQFKGARLNGFSYENDTVVNVHIIAENTPINPSPYYAFKCWSDQEKTVYFKMNYPPKIKHRYWPKTKTNQGWEFIDSTRVIKKDSLVYIKTKLSKTPQLIAAQEIHSSDAVKEWYKQLIKGKESWIRDLVAGKTVMGQEMPYLDMYQGDPQGKEVILFITRQHPPEVTGYLAFQRFMEALLKESANRDTFFKNYRVVVFPIMNPDGVDQGHWRHNANGVDLNRDWSKYRQPEVRNVVKTLSKILKKNDAKLILGIDFHSTWYDVFYTNESRADTHYPQFIDQWFSALESEIDGYKVNEKASNSTTPVSKGWLLYGHRAVGITYEIGDETPRDHIQIIGETSAKALMHILLQSK
ncbi:MAG: M14 family metallopeptidase [Flavobacteriaceae bacterium]|nr:M14 family metallopeptidase [Flavobacteriaceae bacterium]